MHSDIMSGGDDNDILDGGSGSDVIMGGAGTDQGCGGSGWDIRWNIENWTQGGSCGFTPTYCSHVAYPVPCVDRAKVCQYHGQSCNCGSWVTGGAVTYIGGSISCGGGATIPAGSNTLTPHYNCAPNTPDCQATYLWSIDGGGQFAASTYSTNTLSPGTHSIIITPICGEESCGPQCTLSLTIDPNGCNCGSWDTDGAVTYNGGHINCGGVASLNVSDGPSTLTPHYYCNPDNLTCQPIYKWSIDGGGQITAATYSTNALSIGTHSVTITVICGTSTCGQCTFSVIVNRDDCNCGNWNTQAVTYNGGYINCGGEAAIPAGSNILTPHYTCNPDDPNCQPVYKWQIDNGLEFAASNYSTNVLSIGTHDIIITPICGTQLCPPCTLKVYVKTLSDSCKCNKEATFGISFNNSEQEKVKCGKTIKIKKGSTFSVTPFDLCMPKGCKLTGYNYSIYDLQANTFITGQSIIGLSPFNVTLNSSAGYKIVITYSCNGKKCECILYVRTL